MIIKTKTGEKSLNVPKPIEENLEENLSTKMTRREDVLDIKHVIVMNIYNFIVKISNPWFLLIFLFLFVFGIYPVSNMDFSWGWYPISDSLKLSIDSIKSVFPIVVSVIITEYVGRNKDRS